MAMPPGTQYARKAIDGIVENVYNKSYKGGTLGITGPRFLQNEVYNHLEVKDKAFFHFLYVSEDLFDFKNLIQAPGQNEDVEKLEHQRVVIFHNGEYRRHAKSTGSNTYNNNYNNCQVFGEKEPSNLCHQSPESIMENSASNTLNIILLTAYLCQNLLDVDY